MNKNLFPIYDKSWEIHLEKGKIEEQCQKGEFRFIGISTIDLYNSQPELLGKFALGGISTYWSFLVYYSDGESPVFSINCERSLKGQFVIAYDSQYRYNLFQVKEANPITSYDEFKPVALEAFEIFKSGNLKDNCGSRKSKEGDLEIFY